MTAYEEMIKERNRLNREIAKIEKNQKDFGQAYFMKVHFYCWEYDTYAIRLRKNYQALLTHKEFAKDSTTTVARGRTPEECIKDCEEVIKDLTELVQSLKAEYTE